MIATVEFELDADAPEFPDPAECTPIATTRGDQQPEWLAVATAIGAGKLAAELATLCRDVVEFQLQLPNEHADDRKLVERVQPSTATVDDRRGLPPEIEGWPVDDQLDGPGADDPVPEEIFAWCLSFQSAWSCHERRARAGKRARTFGRRAHFHGPRRRLPE